METGLAVVVHAGGELTPAKSLILLRVAVWVCVFGLASSALELLREASATGGPIRGPMQQHYYDVLEGGCAYIDVPPAEGT